MEATTELLNMQQFFNPLLKRVPIQKFYGFGVTLTAPIFSISRLCVRGLTNSPRFHPIMVRISIVVFLLITFCSFLSLVLGLDLSLILVKLKSMILLRLFRILFYRLLGLEVPIFVLVFLVDSIVDSSLHMQDPAGGQPAANPAAEKPSRWTSRFWDKLTSFLF